MERRADMAEAFITEYTGSRGGSVARYYEYDREGVRVFDKRKALIRLYLFDPASDMMTERDPASTEKILRRFLFDRYGMLEEIFSFGQRSRTFRYEDGGRQIAVREGGEYGAVGKLFTFEPEGISETAWGRDGEIARVFVFEADGDAITERAGGWYGAAVRTLVFEGMNASVFREPEAFLQFLMFTERRREEADVHPQAVPVPTGERARSPVARSRFASPVKRRAESRPSPEDKEDARIDFIPDSTTPKEQKEPEEPFRKRSSEISYAERKAGRKS
jgi:hypothetical protein